MDPPISLSSCSSPMPRRTVSASKMAPSPKKDWSSFSQSSPGEYLIHWLTWRFPALRNILMPPSLTLIENGVVRRDSLRNEMLTEDELKSQLREQHVERFEDVKLAKLEGDGRLSVLKREN